MSTLSDPMAVPRLWEVVADGYAREVAPHLARFAEDALRLAEVGPGEQIADVACGPGDLSLAAVRRGVRAFALDFSSQMVACLRERILREGVTAIEPRVGNGMALPYADGSVDAAFSMFGLIFFPDRGMGFRELRRILKPKGRAVISSWVPLERVPLLNDISTSLGALLPNPTHRTPPPPPLGDAVEFRAEMDAAGFRDVKVHEVTHVLEVPSIDDYWRISERNTPPVRAIRKVLGEERWPEVVRQLLASLHAKWGTGPQRIPMIANLAIGRY